MLEFEFLLMYHFLMNFANTICVGNLSNQRVWYIEYPTNSTFQITPGSYHIVSHRIVSYHICYIIYHIPYITYLISPRLASLWPDPQRPAPHRNASHPIASASHRIASHCSPGSMKHANGLFDITYLIKVVSNLEISCHSWMQHSFCLTSPGTLRPE